MGIMTRTEALQWAKANRDDIAEVVKRVERSDTSVIYDIAVVLRSMAANSGYEADDDRKYLWHHEVHFGADDRHHAGGAAFVEAAREQDEIADLIWYSR